MSTPQHHTIRVNVKCPCCGEGQSIQWDSPSFPEKLEGIGAGDHLYVPSQLCCRKNDAQNYLVLSVDGEPVNTDYDPLAVGGEVAR